MGYFARALDNLPKACEDIGVTEKRLHEDAAAVKEWLRQQPHLPNLDGGLVVENMLLRCKGSVELAKQTIEYFFTVRSRYPELFVNNQDPCSPEHELSQRWRKIVILPDLTSTGHRVVVAYVPDSSVKLERNHVHTTLMQGVMHGDLTIDKDIACGVVYVVDARNLSIVHSTMFLRDFPLIQKVAHCIFNGNKFRVKGMHFYQAPPVIDSIMRMVKKILPQKLAGRMHFHTDLASLHEHVDRAILPQEYGGDQKPFLELADDWRREEISHRQWFLDREKAWKTDMSKRPPGSFVFSSEDDAFGVDGSFKKLEFD